MMSLVSNRSFFSPFKEFFYDDEGVAIIEGVLVLPIAILMFIGIFEVGQMLLINQKVYSASHMVSDLLARQAALTKDDLEEAFDAGKLVLEPYDPLGFEIDIVGVRFDDNATPQPEQIWQKAFPASAPEDATLVNNAQNLGAEGEGVIVVAARYTYKPVFFKLSLPFISGSPIFNAFNMREVSVARGRVNSCMSLDDNGTKYTC